MVTFRSPGRGYPYPAPVHSPYPVYEPMFPAAKCLAIQGGVDRMRLEQCAYRGAAAEATPTPGPAAGTRSGVALEGMPVTVRGRAGHVVEHRPNAPPWAGYEYSWRARWWMEDNQIVVLAREATRRWRPRLSSWPWPTACPAGNGRHADHKDQARTR